MKLSILDQKTECRISHPQEINLAFSDKAASAIAWAVSAVALVFAAAAVLIAFFQKDQRSGR